MDVLKPDILVIEGIRYRINPGNYLSQTEKLEEPYENYEEMSYIENVSDGEEDIEEVNGGRFKTSFHVAKTYFPYIIGSKGATKKRLETETHCKISIPKLGQDGDIVITAASIKNVASARRRIRLMVISSRKRQTGTHFLAMPMNGASFQNGFLRFKSEVLEKCCDEGIRESVFQNPEKIHLTIVLFALFDEVERQEAAKSLVECKEVVIKPLLGDDKLKVEMRGIGYMNDDPSKVHVLYGEVSSKNDNFTIHELCDGINTFFNKKGLLVREKNSIKVHITLMNSKYDCKDIKQRQPFDATNILKNFEQYYFGEDYITSLEIYMIGSFKNGKYQVSASIDIP